MGLKIGVVSQKGGVGKSTLCRSIAVAYANAGWDVKIGDMDINQGSAVAWQQRRLRSGITPIVSVEAFGTTSQALKKIDDSDLFVFDGAPHATKATPEIAEASDLVILPTGLSLDDLEPTVILANTLIDKHGVISNKIAFALCRVGNSEKELQDAKEYLRSTPFFLLDGLLQEKTAFRRAQDAGFSVIETTYKKPKEQAAKLMQSIINRASELTD
jgi:chromosome partitioning protein